MVTIKITGVTNAAITEKTTVRPFQSDRVSAVSYTHLDVYKRQVPHNYDPSTPFDTWK